jgi:hypothetical protein
MEGRQRVQLVGGLLIEPLVRGSNPSGAGVFLRGWGLGPHMSNQGTPWRRYSGELHVTYVNHEKCLHTRAYENHKES